ncbi:hypothetical protein QWY90_05245 [Flavobacterium paronense]|uniref:Uncharacterized protein n=1 Tax=Flavobacterium paronense TaxID=1392775 RepID=A0ABV5GC17_9FLAO|nr:hypothetical protein [Flavobacterium paronense]MDN3676715.1 hypothetical protein [Flavobacterium paronense]
MSNQNVAVATYKYFSDLEGNQCIATEFALKIILKLVKNYKAKNILELGVGIGCISFCVMKLSSDNNLNINYVGTESNEFCLKVLPNYLKEHYTKIQLFAELKDVKSIEKFEIIIIDGKDENIKEVESLIATNGIIIIEGDRIPQLNIIRETFPKSIYTRVISNSRNPNYGPIPSTHYSGGVQLIFVDPNFKQKLDYWFYKTRTALYYKIRAFKKEA